MEGVVHPHGGVHPGVVHVVHGGGPDGEHVPSGPRRRFQNRIKPNNLERLPLDEAAKRVIIIYYFHLYN